MIDSPDRKNATYMTLSEWRSGFSQDAKPRAFLGRHRSRPRVSGRFRRDVRAMLRDGPEAETHTQIYAELVSHAWNRILLTDKINRADLDRFVGKARQAGSLRTAPDLSRLVETP